MCTRVAAELLAPVVGSLLGKQENDVSLSVAALNGRALERLAVGDEAGALDLLCTARQLVCQNPAIRPATRSLLAATLENSLSVRAMSLDKPHTALRHLERALALHARHGGGKAVEHEAQVVMLNLTAVLTHLGKRDRALRVAEACAPLACRPDMAAAALFNLGAQYEHASRHREARATYSRARELAAESEDAEIEKHAQRALVALGPERQWLLPPACALSSEDARACASPRRASLPRRPTQHVPLRGAARQPQQHRRHVSSPGYTKGHADLTCAPSPSPSPSRPPPRAQGNATAIGGSHRSPHAQQRQQQQCAAGGATCGTGSHRSPHAQRRQRQQRYMPSQQPRLFFAEPPAAAPAAAPLLEREPPPSDGLFVHGKDDGGDDGDDDDLYGDDDDARSQPSPEGLVQPCSVLLPIVAPPPSKILAEAPSPAPPSDYDPI